MRRKGVKVELRKFGETYEAKYLPALPGLGTLVLVYDRDQYQHPVQLLEEVPDFVAINAVGTRHGVEVVVSDGFLGENEDTRARNFQVVEDFFKKPGNTYGVPVKVNRAA